MPRRRGQRPPPPVPAAPPAGILLVVLLLAIAASPRVAAASGAGRMLGRALPSAAAALAPRRTAFTVGAGAASPLAAAAARRRGPPLPSAATVRLVASAADDCGGTPSSSIEAPSTPATTTTTTTRRRTSPGTRPSREFVGLAKGTDTGRFRAYSADGFVKEKGLFTVLGIETSCDDTGVAVVRSDGVVLGEALASQHAIHEQWGGVVPGLARDAHAQVIDAMVAEALTKAGMASAAEVDAIGATVGPGLEICLRVGCEAGKALAVAHEKPFVCVHHLEAHCLMARIGAPLLKKEDAEGSSSGSAAEFPFLALLVSGGHCMILECRGVGRYRILGGTLDDALGEAYDKAARLLRIGTGVAGGPAIEALAREGNPLAVALPVPMQRKKRDLNFSYAGLKNAFRMAVAKVKEARGLTEEEADLGRQDKADLAASFQHVAIQHLEERLERAMRLCDSPPAGDGTGHSSSIPSPITTLAVVGGVAANQAIRARLQALCEKRSAALAAEAAAVGREEEAPPAWRLVVPPPRLCTDNGVMVAWAAVEKLRLGYSDRIEGQDVYARWPFANPVEESSSSSSSSSSGGANGDSSGGPVEATAMA